MKKPSKNLLNFLLIAVILIVVFAVILNDPSIGTAWEALKNTNPIWSLAAICFFFGFIAFEALSVWLFLRRQGYKISIFFAMFVALEGMFYCNITPGASGGQPMQVYYLYKRGVPIAVSSSALVIRFFCFQLMLSVLGGGFWLTHADYVASNLGGNLWILIVGFTYNTAMITLLLLVTTNRKLVNWLLTVLIRLGSKFRLVKDPDKLMTDANKAADSFHDSLIQLLKSPLDFLAQILICGAQLMSLMTIIWCIYHGLSQSGATYAQLVTLDLAEYLSAAYMPMPGASGASEGVFALYFGQELSGEGMCLAAMLLWRFFTFYISLILGAIATVGYTLRFGKSAKPSEALQAIQAEEEQRGTQA